MDETALQQWRRERLKLAVARAASDNVTELGRLLGYRDGAFVRQMLSGSRAVSDKTVRAIEALPGMAGWFAAHQAPVPGVGARVAEAESSYRLRADVPADAVVAVPAVELQLRAGLQLHTTRAAQGAAAVSAPFFSSAWLQDRGYAAGMLIALAVKDDSMAPSLHPGDMVTVNTLQTDPGDGLVFAVNYEGTTVLRRLVRDSGAWWLSADNAVRYPRKRLVAPDAVLIGRVIHVDSEVV